MAIDIGTIGTEISSSLDAGQTRLIGLESKAKITIQNKSNLPLFCSRTLEVVGYEIKPGDSLTADYDAYLRCRNENATPDFYVNWSGV